ncbi:MAG: hypothetical protein ACFCVE_04760 [Phycisphaerae bacterium]
MLRTIKATTNDAGQIELLEPFDLAPNRQLLITVLDDDVPETAMLAEPALAEYWNRPEEEEAWQAVQDEATSSS